MITVTINSETKEQLLNDLKEVIREHLDVHEFFDLFNETLENKTQDIDRDLVESLTSDMQENLKYNLRILYGVLGEINDL